ncbi:16S rRNA (adenine(1518)-N(6)/adenine(1519)-N(6))-dimethyltransferase RsmA [Prolixibacter denitrificans]|uniref:Ribosomal RNA small subunit methyltransferase A n=1 Tax=Prolixibacter denitrificans TaxID=1541063 RepID=A0A2P8C982_9BACT|nr:16S rRNA (adenine(1518)-N(6)/adenine(1519)-N(6))-dimethyltransferase RsmA [Prolixibacter denitrificans]PSK81527.1 16S rRNA (adenine1518-N6/adenine1519-N6)-dimethyltransferase [Prolixibacter denitrificans]GET21006.1 ribosomal RNA small subunit methyltransferase A [Prolixibacter denitrificans]
MTVRAKKNLGQHFLTDKNIARKIVESLQKKDIKQVLEVGPGMGVLTQFLLEEKDLQTYVVEIDRESVAYLHEHFPELGDRVISGDFLKMNLSERLSEPFALIGNFPYNISSQIFFRVLEYRNHIPEVVGMIQKEVAERIAAGPGSKTYGILSVLLQTWYDIEYLFTVHEHVFSPPPKVKSAVIRLTRNKVESLECDEKLLFTIVKQSFNQRRKTLRNSLKGLVPEIDELDPVWLKKRPEQLSVQEFIELTREIEKVRSSGN